MNTYYNLRLLSEQTLKKQSEWGVVAWQAKSQFSLKSSVRHIWKYVFRLFLAFSLYHLEKFSQIKKFFAQILDFDR